MGCSKSKPKYEIIIDDEDKLYYINIYKTSHDEYKFNGVLSKDVKRFYLVFKKKDQERLPLAIPFEISDDQSMGNQYQFLKMCPNKNLNEIESLCIQYPDAPLSMVFSCDVSPSFPYPVEIHGTVKLKTFE